MEAAPPTSSVRAPSRAVIIVAGAYVVALIVIKLLPSPLPSEGDELPGGVLNITNWFAEATWARGITAEFVLNAVAFVPIGVIASVVFRSWGLRVLTPILLAFAIEAVQLPLAYRVSDPRDIAANTVGALIGLLAMWIVTAYRRDRRAAGLA